MAGPGQKKFTPREKSYLSEYSLKMEGPVQNGAQFPSEFRMAFAANKVAIQVETKLRDAANYGRFEIVVPLLSAMGILETIDFMIKNPNTAKRQYRVKDFVWFGKEKSNEPKVKATLTVGRDNEGCLYIGLSGKDITPIKFIFNLIHDEITDDQGNVINAAEMAEFAAKVFYQTYSKMLPTIMALHYKEPEPKGGAGGGQGNGGQQYGGGNNNRGGGQQYGGGSAPQAPSGGFDDDIPF